MSTSNPARWKMLAVLYSAQLTFALTFQSIPPILGLIMSDLGLSHGQGGALMSMFALPGILISIPAGMLADYYGHRRVGLFSLVVTIMGTLLVAASKNFVLLAGARMIAGFGGMTLAVLVPPALSYWFAPRETGVAMGILNTGMPLGTILSFNFLNQAGLWWGWRVPILMTAGVGLIAFLAMLFTYPSDTANVAHGMGVGKLSLGDAIRQAGEPVWLVAGVWSAYNASVLAYLTFAPDYYISQGLLPGYASFVASLFMIGALFSLGVGYLIDRTNGMEMMLVGGNAAVMVFLLVIFYTRLNPVALGLLIGWAGSFVPAPVYALMPRLVRPERRGAAFGIVSSCMNIGAALGPYLVGHLRDLTASYQGSFLLMAALAFLAIIFAARLRWVRK